MIRILIVDDQKVVRESISALLTEVAEFEVAGTAIDGYEAIACVKDLQPDIILMDIEMPGLDGLEATNNLIKQYPNLKILMLTSYDDDELIARSLAAGAEGYLLKNMPHAEIIRAIRFVTEGYTKIKPSLAVTANKSDTYQNSLLVRTPNNSAITNSKVDNSSLRIATSQQFLPPIHQWLTLSGLACLGIFIGAIAIASQLKYKVTVKAPAKIRPVGELRLVQATAEGKISRILVKENQQIQQGKLIAQIDSTRLQSQKQQLLASIKQNKQQITQIEEQLASIQTQIAAQQSLQQRTIASARVQLEHQQYLYQQQLTAAKAQAAEAEAAVELATEELNRYRELVQTGIVSQLQLKEKTAALKSFQAKLQQAQASLDPSAGQVAMAQEQIAQEIARGETTLASLNRERQQLQERKTGAVKRLQSYQEDLKQIATELESTWITAPLAGTIQTLNLRNPGQVVRAGDEIATIAPGNSSLGIKALVSVRDIGKVEVGQTTQMKVSACPYSDFGTLEGKIASIPPDTKNPRIDVANNDANYEISIQPKNLNLKSSDRLCQIRLGMEGKVDIISKEETVLEFVLGKTKLNASF